MTTDQFPLQTPFQEAYREETQECPDGVALRRSDCSVTSHFDIDTAQREYALWNDKMVDRQRIRAIELTDPPYAFESISSIAANSHGRPMGVIFELYSRHFAQYEFIASGWMFRPGRHRR